MECALRHLWIASRMVQSNPLNIPPDFMDLYISFLRSLVEEQPQGLKETYEFAAKYFERKIEERDNVDATENATECTLASGI
ncbi:UNVERIFIED_CONTAM: hypothetical protein NCL1_13360 [Trichonephila clavipes]